MDNGTEIAYTYDAAGMKLSKEVSGGKSTHYIGGIHYEQEVGEGAPELEFMQHAEGRVLYDGSNWDFQYNLTDHLGNVRVTVDESGNAVQGDDYYPFGLTFNSWNIAPKNQYMFQGQEHQPETGWDQYKWRNADPSIGRFFNVDPLAEDFYYNSTYAFSENKVTVHVELEGLEAYFIHGTGSEPGAWDRDENFRSAIREKLGNKSHGDGVELFSWDGGNNSASRSIASVDLLNHILDTYVPGEGISLVGHSHGGNVAIETLNMLTEILPDENFNLLTLNTPARSDYQLDESIQILGQVEHVNMYFENDVVQQNNGGFGITGKVWNLDAGRAPATPGNPPVGFGKASFLHGISFGLLGRDGNVGGERGTAGATFNSATNINMGKPVPGILWPSNVKRRHRAWDPRNVPTVLELMPSFTKD